jgi:hypothetical protein
MVAPLLFGESLLASVARSYSTQFIMMAWGVSVFAGIALLFLPFYFALQAQGRVRFKGRPPLGLAGKEWGPMAPDVVFPIAFLVSPFAIFLGLRAGLRPAGLAVIVAFGAITLIAYLRKERIRRRQRRELTSRPDATGTLILPQGDGASAVAKVLRIPPEKLYATDQFGREVGSLHLLDETLDRLGGMLLMRQKNAGRRLAVEGIQTLRDYIDEWERCDTDSSPHALR